MTSRGLLGPGAAFVVALVAGQAWAAERDPLQWSEVAVCQTRSDRATCILQVITRHDLGESVLADSDLALRPDILVNAGVDRAALERRQTERAQRTEATAGKVREMLGAVGSGGDIVELRRLTRAGRFDEAAALSDRATTEVWVAERLANAPNTYARMRRLQRRMRTAAELRLKPQIREARRKGDAAELKRLEEELAGASNVPLVEAPDEAVWRAEAEAELVEARAMLVRDAGPTRPEIARRIADRMLQSPSTEQSPSTAGAVRDAAPVLVRWATPAVALTWVERLDESLDPKRVFQEEEFAKAFRAVAATWTVLKRPERVEALAERWTPVAAAQAAAAKAAGPEAGAPTYIANAVARTRLDLGQRADAEAMGVLSPQDWLLSDLLHERVQQHLDEHLQRTGTAKERRRILQTCATTRGDVSVAAGCLQALVAEAKTLAEKRAAATAVLQHGAYLAEPTTQRQLLTQALRLGAELPDETGPFAAGLMSEQEHLVILAKAELLTSPR